MVGIKFTPRSLYMHAIFLLYSWGSPFGVPGPFPLEVKVRCVRPPVGLLMASSGTPRISEFWAAVIRSTKKVTIMNLESLLFRVCIYLLSMVT